MKTDTRIRRAKRVLADAQLDAECAKAEVESRSTGTRAAYKIKAVAADRALKILSERPPR